jgi:hypothetical protein
MSATVHTIGGRDITGDHRPLFALPVYTGCLCEAFQLFKTVSDRVPTLRERAMIESEVIHGETGALSDFVRTLANDLDDESTLC